MTRRTALWALVGAAIGAVVGVSVGYFAVRPSTADLEVFARQLVPEGFAVHYLEAEYGAQVPFQVGMVALTAESDTSYLRGAVDVAAAASDVGWRLESIEVNARSETYAVVRPGARAYITIGPLGEEAASDLRIELYHHADGALVWLPTAGGAVVGVLLAMATVRWREWGPPGQGPGHARCAR